METKLLRRSLRGKFPQSGARLVESGKPARRNLGFQFLDLDFDSVFL
jgi:hypothetical protein